MGDRTVSLDELSAHDGQRSPLVYLSIVGYVYDVTAGAQFYGPGGAYGHMAGRDATVALAKFSMNPLFLNQPWAGLGESEETTLASYVRTFQSKYPCVGTLREGSL